MTCGSIAAEYDALVEECYGAKRAKQPAGNKHQQSGFTDWFHNKLLLRRENERTFQDPLF